MEKISCPDCGYKTTYFIGKLPDTSFFAGKKLDNQLLGGALYQCHSCFLKFRHPILEYEVYERLYDNALSATWTPDGARQDQALVLQYIRNNRSPGASILDVGCYTGDLLGQLGTTFKKYGVEVNTAAAAVAKNSFDVAVWSSLDEIPLDQKFDVILAIDVIEHMYSPRRFVESLLPKLNDRGLVILTTGDGDCVLWKLLGARWWYCYFPEHIAFISKRWLLHYSTAIGMSLQQIKRFNYKKKRFVWLFRLALFVYAVTPSGYKKIVGIIKKVARHRTEVGIPGVGLSADHLFVVFSKLEISTP